MFNLKIIKNFQIFALLIVVFCFSYSNTVFAQTSVADKDAKTRNTEADIASTTAVTESVSSPSGIGQALLDNKDLTKPEETSDKEVILKLLEERPVKSPGLFSFMAWWVQLSIDLGVPANTIVLILLLPILATLIAFIRVIVGLPSLEMLVPIALSYVFVAVGIVTGSIILASVVLAAFISRIVLRKVRIMHYPKRSLSMLLLALLVFVALTTSIQLGLSNIQELSIFPVLIMALLGDSLVSVQLHKKMREALAITSVTIALGLLGFVMATLSSVRDILILYPEIVLLLIPINIIMGRYFGLRLSELIRFRSFSSYGG